MNKKPEEIMKSCSIYPIQLFESFIDKSLMTYRMNFGQQVRSVGHAWFIDGLEQKILVDGGASVPYLNAKGMPATEIQSLEQGLADLGLGFDDIEIVIFTHLHHDHVAEARRFTKARLLVQKRELDFARKPHPSVAHAYPPQFLEGLDFETIDGDVQIDKSVSVLFTPGHTPGGQSVLVRGPQRTAVIAGLCSTRDVFEPPPHIAQQMPVITPGMHTNALDAYDSVLRIKQVSDIVIPNHDPDYQRGSKIEL
jgi:N-acyl homoserine lactone hydrolase